MPTHLSPRSIRLGALRRAQDADTELVEGVGEVELTLVPDGDVHRPSGAGVYGVNAAEGWGAYTPPDADGNIVAMPHSLLVRTTGAAGTTGGVTLIDAGGEHPDEATGRRSDFLEQLAALGVAPADVTTVVITHAHLDHIGHCVRPSGTGFAPTFPRATYVIQQAEADGFRASDPARWDRYFAPLERAGLLRLVTGDAEAAPGQLRRDRSGAGNSPGITCLATPGHTRGHQSVVIDCGESGQASSPKGSGTKAIYLGDLAVTKLHLEHPDWSPAWAWSAEAERESKRKVVALATDALLIFGHDPKMSWGKLVRKGRLSACDAQAGGVEVVAWPSGR